VWVVLKSIEYVYHSDILFVICSLTYSMEEQGWVC